jgi:shikimate dehydrogenase
VNVSGHTRLTAVIGDPVRHSLSPVMHNAAFAATGLDWLFVALPVARGAGGRALDAIRVLGLEGLSVTMPHKADAAAACDEVRGDAARLRSVNCVSRGAGGTLVGESTDGEGFVRALRDAGHDPDGLNALVLGAGGAARAVLLALAQAGAQVRVSARRPDAAADAAGLADGLRTVAWSEVGAVARAADLIVNATPIGMGALGSGGSGSGGSGSGGSGSGGSGSGGSGAASPVAGLPLTAEDLGPGRIVADLVYQPRRTALLDLAAASGAATVEGVGMLVHQGAIAFERWTGTAAPVDVMRAAVLAGLE